MPSMTREQRKEVDLSIGRDGYTRIGEYVVIMAETYDRLQAVVEDGPGMSQIGALVESTTREEDAGDPLLQSYQGYRS